MELVQKKKQAVEGETFNAIFIETFGREEEKPCQYGEHEFKINGLEEQRS